MLPLRDVVDLLERLGGLPEVLVGDLELAATVRWVHVSELTDIGTLLRGGELILTTGIALPQQPAGLRRYVRHLADAGASGLVVELGRRWSQLPDVLVRAAERANLPLVVLQRPVAFVAVTESVHTSIVNAQYELLRQSESAHRAFTALSVEGASAADVIERVAAMTGHAVVLEDMAHRAVASAAPGSSTADLLADWEPRSRQAPGWDVTTRSGPRGWLVTPVGPTSQRWGRLVMPDAPGENVVVVMVLERAAEALALNRLVERDEAGVLQQAHRTLVQTLLADHLEGRATVDADARARAKALGLAVEGRGFVGVAVWSPSALPPHTLEAERRDRALADAVARATRAARVSALVAIGDPGQVLLVVATRPGGRTPVVLQRLAEACSDQLRSSGWVGDHSIGVGHDVERLADVASSLTLAGHVADVASSLTGTSRRAYHHSSDVRLRGVLASLSSDPRLTSFAAAELAPLRAYDAAHGTDLVDLLRDHLRLRGNKSDLARARHLSRPALYARLSRIESLLGVRLDEAESALSLHVAVLVSEVAGRAGH